ncbi:MAG TPA: malate/lactate/ureidoglycolate dehydrogenase [Candidatus Dormibacteraeota bacterium]|nr:malate/lactate/ureidoglycolate dehydrogenase [Candidatus Dormibacteraeota bacterium]
MRLAPDRLRRLTASIIARGGSESAEADLVAGHLVDANLAGHDSHGVSLIPHYVRHLKEGLVVPNTSAKVVKDDGAFLMLDGQRGFGRRVAGEAMAAAMERCGETGVAIMTLANAHHIGRVGAYGELASAAGLVSIHFVNVADHRGLVAPFRGSDARFSTNPVCIGMPGTENRPPLLLDMATSGVAMGKVLVAKLGGRRLPEGNLIDAQGAPTTDPEVMYREPRGALLPFGAHKGYALAVLTELLAGGMSGGGTIQPENPRRGGIVNNMFSIVVDPARLAGTDWMRREIDGFVGYVKGSPPADPTKPVLVPGDPERLSREERRRAGIPLDAATWEELVTAGAAMGLTRAQVEEIGGPVAD